MSASDSSPNSGQRPGNDHQDHQDGPTGFREGPTRGQLRRAFSAPPAERCPPLLELAAWLDGRLDAAERDVVEAHLAECSECLSALGEVRAWQDLDADGRAALAPAAVLEAARALVPAAPARPARAPAWRWGVGVAASLAVCFLGYRVGMTSFPQVTAPGDQLVAEMTFGVIGVEDEVAGDLDLLGQEVTW